MKQPSSSPPWVLIAAGFHSSGGMDKANLALAQYLLDQEVPVHIVGHSVDAELIQHPLATVYLVSPPLGMLSLGEPLLDWKGRRVARNVTRRWPNAQVVVNGGNCIWPGINWVHYVHHAWRPPASSGHPWHRIKSALFHQWARKRERAALLKASIMISNSRYTSQHLIDHIKVDERKVRTIYLGTDPQWGPVTAEERTAGRLEFNIAVSRPTAVFVGALGFDHRKGFDVLFQAWRGLCADPDWDVDLLVAGTGRALGMWQAKVAQAGLSERIRLLGFSKSVRHLLAAADLLVSPVRYEAYGLNVQEAICRGVPSLVSSSAGVAERYGVELSPMLVPDPENVADLMGRLRNWRSQMNYWKAQFSSLGGELRDQSWPKMAEQIVSLVQQGLERDGEQKQLALMPQENLIANGR